MYTFDFVVILSLLTSFQAFHEIFLIYIFIIEPIQLKKE